MLANAHLGHDNRRAVSLFQTILAEADMRDAWIGLASAYLGLGDANQAVDALGQAMRRHVCGPGIAPLADAIARAAGLSGWDVPVDEVAIGRVEGFVEAWQGGLRGWAAHPGNLEAKPVLILRDASGRAVRRIVCSGEGPDIGRYHSLLRPRRFRVSAGALDGILGPLRVIGQDGRDLLGSPLVPNPPARTVAVPIKPVDRTRRPGRVHVVRWDTPDAVNIAIAAFPDRDVVLLHGDVVLPPDGLRRLKKAAYAASDIGIVTPLLATSPDRASERDRLARQANRSGLIEIPFATEPCVFIKRSCLEEVGGFDGGRFAQGHGAGIDFSLRARDLGWRHVTLPSLVVGYDGEPERRPARDFLRARDARVLRGLHPGYDDLATSAVSNRHLAAARRRLDIARWRALSAPGQRSVVLITHAHGGGVARRVQDAANALRAGGFRPIVVRAPGTIDDGEEGRFADLRFDLPDELAALSRFLRAEEPHWVEVHHTLGHSPAIYEAVRRLKVPYDVHIHDYAWICPRISLVDDRYRYCGEPDLAGCETCIARNGSLTGETIAVGALRRRSGRFLANARRVVVPSTDAAIRPRRYYPGLRTDIVPHGADAGFPRRDPPPGVARVCVLGGIGPHKGFDVLLDCARDAVARNLALEFVVVGDTTGDEDLLATGRVHITGTYRPDEAVELVEEQGATIGFVPSVWPETWCLTLTELWQAGLPVVAFDLGAQAERIRATGRGRVLPLGLPASAINDAIMTAIAQLWRERDI